MKKPKKIAYLVPGGKERDRLCMLRTTGSVIFGMFTGALKCTSKTDNIPISHGVERERERARVRVRVRESERGREGGSNRNKSQILGRVKLDISSGYSHEANDYQSQYLITILKFTRNLFVEFFPG